ncbi:MAG: hypothetical protein EOO85_19830 [Pedobacter sp.]|nr:MAG: hypothetical protein EOO85_19830 [Pedobacter sp.]
MWREKLIFTGAMSIKRSTPKVSLIFALFIILLAPSCAKEAQSEVTVYENGFESNDLSGITSGAISAYNGSKILGFYNKSGFTLQVDELPAHDLVEVSFDLFIHDTWDGNKQGVGVVNGPDMWKMIIDGKEFISTTFSNTDCGIYTCNTQSFPFAYPNFNTNPKTGAFRTDLPGLCLLNGTVGGTTQYKIKYQVRHERSTLIIQCLDELKESIATDQLCDESWSIDNLKVKAISL